MRKAAGSYWTLGRQKPCPTRYILSARRQYIVYIGLPAKEDREGRTGLGEAVSAQAAAERGNWRIGLDRGEGLRGGLGFD